VSRGKIELADIFQAHVHEYFEKYPASFEQKKAVRDITQCRSSALGGHLYRCNSCGHEDQSYNSCRNRHCPKCQGSKSADWVDARKKELLPVQYFHTVFTLPDDFHGLVLQNKKLMYELLFKAVSKTLLQIGKKNLGLEIGFFSVLHSWGQSLTLHPHIHCVIPGCGISNDGKVRYFKNNYFVSDKILSPVFRGKFLELLKRAFKREKKDLPQALLQKSYSKNWVVKTQASFAQPEPVIKYLARYVNKIAITNSRILSLKDGQVTFRYQDYQDESKSKTMTLSALEFIRRFLQHVLPKAFMRVRYYGFLTACKRKSLLSKMKLALIALYRKSKGETQSNPHRNLCSACKLGIMTLVTQILPEKIRISQPPPLQNSIAA
jgi:predicted Zn-ribbon and HTH transcriptional regulator